MISLFNNTNIFANNMNGQIGTIGGFFQFSGDNTIYGITNFHVVEIGGTASVGAPLFQKGSGLQIGTLQYWYQPKQGVSNYFDMALFAIDPSAISPAWNSPVGGFADANSATDVQINFGNNVLHTGLSNGIQQGPFNITIGNQQYKFTNLLQIQSSSSNYQFSYPGDSGSLIFAGDQIVALLLGGDPNNPFISYGIPFVDSVNNKGILNTIGLNPYGI
jgi:hypothetical protein